MDLTDAVNAHTDWKVRLRGAISDRSTLDLDAIASDDRCDLGRWLHGASREKYGALPAHRDCVIAHAGFHRCAAEVAALINAGEYARAERLLAAGTRYALASRMIVLAIDELRRQVGEHDAAHGDGSDA
jgi:methyl-accepting chemotaxis protein